MLTIDEDLNKILKKVDILKTYETPDGNPFMPSNLSVDEAKQAIKALLTKSDREARLDELKNTVVAQGNYPPDRSYVSNGDSFFCVPTTELEDRIKALSTSKESEEAPDTSQHTADGRRIKNGWNANGTMS